MSEWKISAINVNLQAKTATVQVQKGTLFVTIQNVQYDEPGQQTEAELKQLALQAAKREIEDLLSALPA